MYIIAKHLQESSQSFMENAIARGTISDESNWEEYIENISPDTDEENANWEAWYIRWIESVISLLSIVPNHDDTVGRDNIARFMNHMTSIHYGYHLIKCDVCDTVHRLYNDKVYPDEVQVWVSIACSWCWSHINHDDPDLFF